MFFSFAFCTFFKIFHVRLGKKSKSVSFLRVYVCVKAKLTLVSFFFYFFSMHLSLTCHPISFPLCQGSWKRHILRLKNCKHSLHIGNIHNVQFELNFFWSKQEVVYDCGVFDLAVVQLRHILLAHGSNEERGGEGEDGEEGSSAEDEKKRRHGEATLRLWEHSSSLNPIIEFVLHEGQCLDSWKMRRS